MFYGFIKIAVLAVMLSSCSLAHSVFTNPSGRITIDRQDFINTYAIVKVLYKHMLVNLEELCASSIKPPEQCVQLPLIKQKAHELNLKIEAKIEVPESEIDWGTVKELLSALISLVP